MLILSAIHSAFIDQNVFFVFYHSRSTSWSTTQCRALSVCSAVWKWMIQSVSLPSFERHRFINLASWHEHQGCRSRRNCAKLVFIRQNTHKDIAFISLACSYFARWGFQPHEAGAEWSRVSGWNVGCTSIVWRGALSPVKSSFEHIWSCFCETRRAAPISCWEADAHRMASGV